MVMKVEINVKLIGKRIRHRREAKGFSQEQLAEKLNLSKNHISSIARGKTLLTTARLIEICNVLGGTPDYYLLGEISAETDAITQLVNQLSPKEQAMLRQLLTTYLTNCE